MVILWKNNYAALKIIDVGIFLFYFIKIFFPVHFLFKWRQNLSARPRNMHCGDESVSGLVSVVFVCGSSLKMAEPFSNCTDVEQRALIRFL